MAAGQPIADALGIFKDDERVVDSVDLSNANKFTD